MFFFFFLLYSVKENVGSSESIMESFRLKGMQQKGGPSHYLLSVDTKTLGGRALRTLAHYRFHFRVGGCFFFFWSFNFDYVILMQVAQNNALLLVYLIAFWRSTHKIWLWMDFVFDLPLNNYFRKKFADFFFFFIFYISAVWASFLLLYSPSATLLPYSFLSFFQWTQCRFFCYKHI